MSNEDLSKYNVGQKVWLIDTEQEVPGVSNAIIIRKEVVTTKEIVAVYLEYKDSVGNYRHSQYSPVYRTKKGAEKHLAQECERVLKHRISNYEAKVNNISTAIKLQQRELKQAKEKLAEYWKKLEKLK